MISSEVGVGNETVVDVVVVALTRRLDDELDEVEVGG